MMGLPTETYEDLDGIALLAEKVLDAFYQNPNHEGHAGIMVHKLDFSIGNLRRKVFLLFLHFLHGVLRLPLKRGKGLGDEA